MNSLRADSIWNNPHARWQRGSSAGSIINWIFYCSVDRSLARSYCLMGIGLGSNIFSRPLTMIGKVSPRCVTSQAARTRPSVYSVAWRQQPESEHFTLLGFLVGVAISMALVGLHLWAGKEAAQPCPTSRWMKWWTQQVWLPTWQIFVLIFVKATILSIDTLRGFYQTLLAECLKSESRKNMCIIKL